MGLIRVLLAGAMLTGCAAHTTHRIDAADLESRFECRSEDIWTLNGDTLIVS